MWDRVISAAAALAVADPTLMGVYAAGAHVRLAGSGDHRVPLLEYTLIADGIEEQWAPHTIQFDQFTDTLEDLSASEAALRRLFHTELPEDIGGMMMWTEYRDGEPLASPSRDGYYGRAIRFRLTPLGDRYQPAP